MIAGAGSNATAEAIAFTEHAEKAGADGVLHVTPYYNKPTQDGLYAHFEAINNATKLPIILYNIPGRSIVDMTPETMGRLAQLAEYRRRERRDLRYGARCRAGGGLRR